MKILNTVLGIVAIGGAVAYTRKHGGVMNAINRLLAKTDEILRPAPETSIPIEANGASKSL